MNSYTVQVPEKEVNKVRQSNEVKNESQIYCKLIDFSQDQTGVVLVKSQTSAFSKVGGSLYSTLAFVQKSLIKETLDDSTVSNFKKVNGASQSVKDSIKCNRELIFIPEEEFEESFTKPDGWGAIRKKYTDLNSIIGFSGIGYSDKGDQALVYMGKQNGEKSGSGFYFFFIKDASTWKLVNKVNVWES